MRVTNEDLATQSRCQDCSLFIPMCKNSSAQSESDNLNHTTHNHLAPTTLRSAPEPHDSRRRRSFRRHGGRWQGHADGRRAGGVAPPPLKNTYMEDDHPPPPSLLSRSRPSASRLRLLPHFHSFLLSHCFSLFSHPTTPHSGSPEIGACGPGRGSA